MKRTIATMHLTKDYIESKVSQVAIMSKYLNIPIDVINDCVEYGHLITSIFRDDDVHKSMGFAFNQKGRLKVRDFGGTGFFEDVYGTVAYVLSIMCERKIEPNNKKDFYFILNHIARTFSDVIDGKTIDENLDDDIANAIKKGQSKKTLIDIVPRSWNRHDKEYWNKLGVNLNYLNSHFVVPVEQYYLNRGVNSDPKYYYKSSDPCYAYMLGQNRKGVYLIKLYFPLRNRVNQLKFVTNCNVPEGLHDLEFDDYDYIVITKSSKDRLSLGCYLHSHPFYGVDGDKLNIGVINLPSENYHLKENEFSWLSDKVLENGLIVSLLDFDRTGRIGAKYLRDTYNIPYIFITRGELGLGNYKCKDFSELYANYPIDDIDRFIKNTINYVEEKYRYSIN